MQISKYNASGNDFVIFHTFKEIDRSDIALKLCDRQKGIGADGLIVLLPHDKLDFKWQFYNSDGSVASMCGNGTRACAHYAYTNGLADENMSFLTGAGVIDCQVERDIVKTKMTPYRKLRDSFEEHGKLWHFYDTGVPHLVNFTDDIDKFDIELARDMRYKYNANVNFAKIIDDSLKVRTYERGVENETLACGTGMVACFVSAFESNQITNSIKVYPTSNEELEISMENKNIYFKGKVSKVFDATI